MTSTNCTWKILKIKLNLYWMWACFVITFPKQDSITAIYRIHFVLGVVNHAELISGIQKAMHWLCAHVIDISHEEWEHLQTAVSMRIPGPASHGLPEATAYFISETLSFKVRHTCVQSHHSMLQKNSLSLSNFHFIIWKPGMLLVLRKQAAYVL
jgi:hypothetical protein